MEDILKLSNLHSIKNDEAGQIGFYCVASLPADDSKW